MPSKSSLALKGEPLKIRVLASVPAGSFEAFTHLGVGVQDKGSRLRMGGLAGKPTTRSSRSASRPAGMPHATTKAKTLPIPHTLAGFSQFMCAYALESERVVAPTLAF